MSGTPSASGTFNITVTATDSVGATTSHSYSLVVNPASSTGIQWVQDASMGYSFSSETSQATGAFSKNPTIGDTIVVWCWAWDAGGWTSGDITCSDNLATHNTYTQAGFIRDGSAAFCFFYTTVANTGAGYTPIITVHSVTDPAISVAASEFSGIASSNPIDGKAVTAVGKGTPASLGKMNVKANDLVLAGLSWNEDSAVRIAKPSGWTQSANALDDGAIDPNQDTEYGNAIYSLNPTSPTAPSWTVSGTSSATDTWCASQLAFLSNNSPLAISPSSLPASTVGVAYSQTVSTAGGTGSVTLSESGALPAGLTFTASTGALSGRPTAGGTFNISITATDSVGDTASQAYSLVINPAVSLSPSSLPASTVGVAYSQKFTTTGGTGSVTLSESGALPAGLTFTASTGTLSGTPTASGTFNISVTATDTVGATTSHSYSLVVNPASSTGIQWVQDASMGYSFSSETSQATGAFSKNPTIGNTIVVWCWAWDAGGWSSSDITCSDNLATHNTYTQAGFVQNGSAAFCFFYANVANTGAGYTPVITVHSVTDPAISVAASEFSGIASSNPIDGTAVTAVGKGTPASLGKMNVKANDLVLAGLSWNEDSAVRITAPSGWTQSGNALDDGAIDPNQYTEFGDAIYSINPTSPTAPSWSVSGTSSATDTWCASQLAFLGAS